MIGVALITLEPRAARKTNAGAGYPMRETLTDRFEADGADRFDPHSNP
jgi:hypothetical protein